MLSPSVNVAETLLTQAFNETLSLDSYARSANDLFIGRLPQDPNWLATLRSRTAMLSAAGASWIQDKPNVWAPLLSPFTSYASAFDGVAAMASQHTLSSQQWTRLLS